MPTQLLRMALMTVLVCLLLYGMYAITPAGDSVNELRGIWKYQPMRLSDLAPENADVIVRSAARSDPSWKEFDYPDAPPLAETAQGVWMTTTLSMPKSRSDALFFMTADQSFRIWVGSKLIYSYGEMEPQLAARGMRWHFVELPEHYAAQ